MKHEFDIPVTHRAVTNQGRAVTLAALGVVLALAWAYVAHLAAGMGRMNTAMVMPQAHPWSMAEIFWLIVMWAVMMTAMMIPSAAPTVLVFASIAGGRSIVLIEKLAPAGRAFSRVTGIALMGGGAWLLLAGQ